MTWDGFAAALGTFALFGHTGSASVSAPQPLPRIEGVSSTNFVFIGTRVHANGDELRVDGLLCRKPNRSVMSAVRAQIEQVSFDGDVLFTSYTYLPHLSMREDQRCGGFGVTLAAQGQRVDRVRICIARKKAPCLGSK